MSIQFKIFRDLGVVYTRWTDVASDKKLHKAYRTLYEHPHWQPGFHELSDLREAPISNITADGFRKFSALCEAFTKGKCEVFKSAVIVPDDITYGLTRLYEISAYESPECIQMFKTMDDAMTWMNITEEDLEGPCTEIICGQ